MRKIPSASSSQSSRNDIVEQLAARIERGVFLRTACDALGLSYTQVRKWMIEGQSAVRIAEDSRTPLQRRQVAFYARIAQASANTESRLVDVVVKSAENGETLDAKWMLERRFGMRWKTKLRDEYVAEMNAFLYELQREFSKEPDVLRRILEVATRRDFESDLGETAAGTMLEDLQSSA